MKQSTLLLIVIINSFFLQGFSADKIQNLTPYQKAWMFRVIIQSPVLKRNLSNCTNYTGPLIRYRNGKADFDAMQDGIIEDTIFFQYNPDKISKQSNGVLLELSVKLSLWELYNLLKTENHNILDPALYSHFEKTLINSIPTEEKKGRKLKKANSIIQEFMWPSLKLSEKLKLFEDYEIKTQKKIISTWNRLIDDYIRKRSDEYYTYFSGNTFKKEGVLLSAGEGSGSVGLLYEYELIDGNPTKSGNGKGVGLFNYQVKKRKGKLVPDVEQEKTLKSIPEASTLLHLSLWGINNQLKPTIIISKGEKSYLLFAEYSSREIFPDPNIGSGKSYFDNLANYKYRYIDKLISELTDSNGLRNRLNEYYIKQDAVYRKINTATLDIDSILQNGINNDAFIESRKESLKKLRETIQSRKARINNLEKKISQIELKLDLNQAEYRGMLSELGENQQQYTLTDSLYIFDDSTVFNVYTQDLYFPSTEKAEDIKVKLMATGFNARSKKVDEVQMYVSLTEHIDKTRDIKPKPDKPVIETTEYFEPAVLEIPFYFASNSFQIQHDSILRRKTDSIKNYINTILPFIKDREIIVSANGVFDKANQNIIKKYPGKNKLEKEQSKNTEYFRQQRKCSLKLALCDSILSIRIDGWTDPVPTQLKELAKKHKIQKYKDKNGNYNTLLSALRAIAITEQLRKEEIIEEEYIIDDIPMLLEKSIIN